jgi:signal transduction histidine kinase
VEGFGLGLSIAMWIAGLHQATLSVTSKENAGSAFKIEFPLFAIDRQPLAPPVPDSLANAR